jgi:hypothetical protein
MINERFGMHLGPPDQLLFDQFEETWASDPDLAAQAQHNDLANFRLAFDRRFMNTVVTRTRHSTMVKSPGSQLSLTRRSDRHAGA